MVNGSRNGSTSKLGTFLVSGKYISGWPIQHILIEAQVVDFLDTTQQKPFLAVFKRRLSLIWL